MAGSVTVPNSFATAPGPIPLIQLDQNFSALASATNAAATYSNYFVDSSGAPNSVIVTIPAPGSFSYTAGIRLQVKLANTNTSATVTINVNGLGNQNIVTAAGVPLVVGQLPSGSIIDIIYNGTNFIILNVLPFNYPTYFAVQTALTSRAVAAMANDPVFSIAIPSAGTYQLNLNCAVNNTTGGNGDVTWNINYSGTFNTVSSYFYGTGVLASVIAAGAAISSTVAGSSTNQTSALQPNATTYAGGATGTLFATGAGALALAWASSGSNMGVGYGSFSVVKIQ